jgi:hypothetical protein
MERKKSISIILLSMTVLMLAVQVYMTCSVADQTFGITNKIAKNEPIESPYYFNPNAINITAEIEPIWFVLNLVIVILTPIGMIITAVLVNKKKNDNIPSTKAEITEETTEEQKLLNNPETLDIQGRILSRMGLLVLFIQNILILVIFILFFILFPFYEDAQTPINVIRTYLILFDVDFIASILIAVGILLVTLRLSKNKVLGFIAFGSLLAFVGLAL